MSPSTLLGTGGVAMLLVAFGLNLTGRLSARSIAYRGLNVVGAGLACAASVLISFVPFVVLEGAWLVVGLAGFLGAGRQVTAEAQRAGSDTPSKGSER